MMKYSIKAFIGLVFAGLLLFSCESERPLVKIALETEGKVYLFSSLTSFLVGNTLKQGDVPVIFSGLRLYNEEGKLFIGVRDLNDLLNLMGGNYDLHASAQDTNNGYVTLGKQKAYFTKYHAADAKTIGEQLRTTTLIIPHPSKADTFKIAWEEQLVPYKVNALENCEPKTLNINRSQEPESTATVEEKVLMVNLKKIADFYSNTTIRYNKEDGILYVVK